MHRYREIGTLVRVVDRHGRAYLAGDLAGEHVEVRPLGADRYALLLAEPVGSVAARVVRRVGLRRAAKEENQP